MESRMRMSLFWVAMAVFLCLTFTMKAEAPWNITDENAADTTLEDIVARPDAFLGELVRFACRYHKAEDMFNPYYTGLSKYEYNNFSVWGLKAVLFHEKNYASDVPFLFVEKESAVSLSASKLHKYEVVTITGRVVNTYLGKPWIVVTGICGNIFSVTLSDPSLIRARLGLELLDKGESQAAADEFEAVLDTRLDSYLEAQVQKYYGKALLDSGDFAKAADALDDSYDEIEDADAGAWLAQALLNSHNPSSAASHAKDVVEAFPTHLESRLVYAEALAKLGKVDDCVQHARVALSLDAGNSRAYASMAEAFVKGGDDLASLDLLREAESKAQGDHGIFHKEMGRIYYRQGRYDFSVNEFELAKRSFPGDASVFLETARALRERGEKYYRSAAVNFSRSLELDPTQVDPRLELGMLLYKGKEYGEASRVLADYVERRPDDLGALVISGLTNEWTGAFEPAAKSFTLAESKDGPGYHSLHLGFCLLAMGHEEEAAHAYARGAESDMEDRFRFEAAFRASGLFLKMGHERKALRMASLAHKLDPAHTGAHINLLLSHERSGDHESAFQCSTELLSGPQADMHLALLRQHQAFNALALGHPSDDILGWATTGYQRQTEASTLTLGLAYAKAGRMEGLDLLSKVSDSHPLARLGVVELLLASGKVEEAKAIFESLEEPQAKGFRTWYDELEDKLGL